jgi:hypothetical protein
VTTHEYGSLQRVDESAAGLSVWRAALGISDGHVLKITMLESTCDWGSLIRCASPAPGAAVSAFSRTVGPTTR